MELKDQVQGVVIGLFGAYAGGYFADLTSQAETGNPVALVEGLVNLQTPLLGVNLSDDAAWVDTILGHLGVSSTSAAYTAAAAWANGELDAGASRAEVVLAAVTYLLGDSVEAQYASVATAFKADVAAGVVYSEGEGAEVLAIGDLREAAGNPATGTSFNLTAALAEWQSAVDAEEAYIDAWGLAQDPVIKAADSDAGDVTGALTAAELALQASDLNANNLYAVTDSAATKAAKIAVLQAGLDDALKTATTNQTNATTAVKAVTGLQTAVDAFATSYAAAVTAEKAAIASENNFAGVKTQFALDNTLTAANIKLAVTDTTVTIYNDAANAGVVDAGEDIAIYTIATGVWADGAHAKAATTALQDAAVATYTANKAASDALELANVRLDTVEGIGAGVYVEAVDVEGLVVNDADIAAAIAGTETAATELAGIAATYAAAAAGVTAANKNLTDFAALTAKITNAQTSVTELKVLQDAKTDLVTAIEAEGYDVASLANGANSATAKDDVFLLDGLVKTNAATITNFNFAGSDVIVASEYTQGADITKGDDAVLEFFVKQVGANTEITFETQKYGSDLVGVETFKVTLAGVAAADVDFSNGYILIA